MSKFQGVLKMFMLGVLKTIICVENYVETACWKFQHVLKTVMHVESYVKISRCVENVYVRRVENDIENRVEVWKKHHHTLRHVLKLSGRFRFFLRFRTRKRSETYLSITNTKVPGPLSGPLTPATKSLAWLCFTTWATFSLRSWAPFDQILDPYPSLGRRSSGEGDASIRFCQKFLKTAWNWENFGRGMACRGDPRDPPLISHPCG